MSDGRTRAEVRLVGHWRQLRAAVILAVFLLLLQWPMRHAVQAGDPTWPLRLDLRSSGPACEVPARLSLMVDLALIYTYLVAAWRVHGYLGLLRPVRRTARRLGLAGAVLVTVAGVVDVAENAVLWQRFGSPAGGGVCPSLQVGLLSPALWVLWTGGVVLAVAAVAVARPNRPGLPGRPGLGRPNWLSRLGRQATKRSDPGAQAREESAEAVRRAGAAAGPDLTRHDRTRQIICCSGGGIRSAAFSLGALQVLNERGEYQRSSTVIGVSGGGYIAAAFHILRRSLTGAPGEKLPYAMGTPELARLRRHTHYMLPSLAVGARAIMSLLYGVVVNLVLIGIALRGIAWVLGWAIAETSVVSGLGTALARTNFGHLPAWYWLAALGPLGIVIALFLAEVMVDRFRVPPNWLRREGRALARILTLPGLLSPALLLGIPLVLAWANNFGHESSGRSGLAEGLAGTASGVAGVAAVSANSAVDSQFGFATLAALGAAFIALARSAWKGMQSLGSDTTGGLRDKVLTWLRTKLVPWAGSALLLMAVLVVLLRWTAGYAASEEWRSRWWVAALCVGALVLIRVFTDATRTSLHPYYRERLAIAYLVGRATSDREAESAYSKPLPYSEYARATDGGPRLVIVASANAADTDFIPPDRGCVPFVFDPDRSGLAGDVTLPTEGLEPTASYELRADHRRRDVTVPGAVAISGAAFSPLTGRNNATTRPMRLLFAVVNARLGVWLPNPYWGTTSPAAALARRCELIAGRRAETGPRGGLVARFVDACAYVASIADKPGAHQLFREAFGRTSLYDRRLYVTDGGHYDNLGLVEALRRRPGRLIVIDASNDLEDTFAAVGSAIASARMDLGVDVRIDLRPLQRKGGERIGRGWARGTATYPEGGTAEILIVKAVLAGNLPWDLETYAAEHPDFPRRSTGDQLYGEFDFEAYRALGETLTREMLDRVQHTNKVPVGDAAAGGGRGPERATVPVVGAFAPPREPAPEDAAPEPTAPAEPAPASATPAAPATPASPATPAAPAGAGTGDPSS
ncbi:hypothetical protein [Actinopolymorpha pittospori]|uniref:Patatin-like phospholipase n=1 Tax=Actinopolymorpha pittospori TaxID=648752 RepID=A0A927RHS5_9ACTN|nr:hypothetical protein [Actinopolymorpha pittospori]MBE1612525.1 hypothetical protein [Actinopolymorpha pittospori]